MLKLWELVSSKSQAWREPDQFLFACRVTSKGPTSSLTLGMELLCPMPTLAPLRMASNMCIRVRASSRWRHMQRTTLVLIQPSSSFMWFVSSSEQSSCPRTTPFLNQLATPSVQILLSRVSELKPGSLWLLKSSKSKHGNAHPSII